MTHTHTQTNPTWSYYNADLKLKNNFFKNSKITESYTLKSAYIEVTFNEKLAIMKENLHIKYTTFTYNDIALNEKPPIMKQNLKHIFFIIGRVECNHSLL